MPLRRMSVAVGSARRLEALTKHRRQLVDQRVALGNQLLSLLKAFFPALTELKASPYSGPIGQVITLCHFNILKTLFEFFVVVNARASVWCFRYISDVFNSRCRTIFPNQYRLLP
jgi:hypothetical protein